MLILKKIIHPSASVSHGSIARADAGFTLIELMISLVLGLLVAAAGTQLFMGGVISLRLQQAGADTQDNGLFGLDFMAKDIRLANFGNVNYWIAGGKGPRDGVVITPSAVNSTTPISKGLVTSGWGDATSSTTNEWQGLANVQGTTASDQLTIQFQAPFAMTDCEGGQAAAGDQVIQRYFVRVDTTSGPASDPNVKNLVLACNSGRVAGGVVTGLGGAGQVIMNRVDQFHILLGTHVNPGNSMAYYTVNAYKGLTGVPPSIVSVQIAVLVRSLDNTGNSIVDPNKSYTLFEQSVTPIAATNQNANRYVRQVYLTTVALRNAMGAAS